MGAHRPNGAIRPIRPIRIKHAEDALKAILRSWPYPWHEDALCRAAANGFNVGARAICKRALYGLIARGEVKAAGEHDGARIVIAARKAMRA